MCALLLSKSVGMCGQRSQGSHGGSRVGSDGGAPSSSPASDLLCLLVSCQGGAEVAAGRPAALGMLCPLRFFSVGRYRLVLWEQDFVQDLCVIITVILPRPSLGTLGLASQGLSFKAKLLPCRCLATSGSKFL